MHGKKRGGAVNGRASGRVQINITVIMATRLLMAASDMESNRVLTNKLRGPPEGVVPSGYWSVEQGGNSTPLKCSNPLLSPLKFSRFL